VLAIVGIIGLFAEHTVTPPQTFSRLSISLASVPQKTDVTLSRLLTGSNVAISVEASAKPSALKPVFGQIDPLISPFESGQSDCLMATTLKPTKTSKNCRQEEKSVRIQDLCNSSLVDTIVDKLKNRNLDLLLVIGSADRFELHGSLQKVYGSNENLGQARADQIRECLKNRLSSPLIITMVRGAEILDATDRTDTGQDRSVAVYGLWSEKGIKK
jgi:hypothetical protein